MDIKNLKSGDIVWICEQSIESNAYGENKPQQPFAVKAVGTIPMKMKIAVKRVFGANRNFFFIYICKKVVAF